MTAPCLTLKSGGKMPQVGLGMWKIPPTQVVETVVAAIDCGYRHFDSACDYGNEVQTGEGLAQAFSSGKCRRDEVWVTSKLWNTYHAPEHVRPALERQLADLQLDYLDLYLIHFPIAQAFVPFEKRYPPGWFFDPSATNPRMEFAKVPIHETWRAMEELVKAGLVRHIGISNFTSGMIRDLLTYAEVMPEVLQIELHPLLTQEKLVRYAQEEGMVVTAFSSLGSPSYVPLQMADPSESLLNHPTIMEIGQETGKTSAQVLLRWAIERQLVVIPKTTKRERLLENIDLFDFQLDGAQIAAISALNRNRRFNDPADFGETTFNTFCPIYD
jgi:D-xylose reductase